MKQKICIILLLLFKLNASYSQKTIKEYWDSKHKLVRIEYQVNAAGVYNGFYRTYYAIGGYEKTGFYTNGQKTGLWSDYKKGASKPYWQVKLVFVDGDVYKLMEKEWFDFGVNSGKLRQWTEWDATKKAQDYGQPENFNNGFLVTRYVVYSTSQNGYIKLRDFEFGKYDRTYDENGVLQ